jgi:histidine triad (HIT) family protein
MRSKLAAPQSIRVRWRGRDAVTMGSPSTSSDAVSSCVFCAIVRGEAPASIVYADAASLAVVDLRQFHPGHVLVIPRAHLNDVRELDESTGAALMATVVRVTRAVAAAFPAEGYSLWHSIGPAAHQEVPHLHVHIHPRRIGDGILRVYPAAPPGSRAEDREAYAARIRARLV